MIIIEGTDKAGKTTFLSNLLRFFPPGANPNIFHFGVLPDNWDYCDDYINYVRSNIILDRFMDSERAYGPVYRGQVNPKLTTQNMNKVYRKCSEIGALTVYCNPKIDEVMNRLNREGDEFIKKQEQLQKLRMNFEKIFDKDKYPLELEIIDTTAEIDPNTLSRIVDKSLMLERNARSIKNLGYRGYVSPSSKYIIYTNELETNFLLIDIFCDHRITDFSLILSRDIENNPVNITKLVSCLPNIKEIHIHGKEAEKDFINANNINSARVYHENKVLIKTLFN